MVVQMIHDRDWIEVSSLEEMQDAVRNEPPESELFQGELGHFFWEVYRMRIEERYRVEFP